MIGNWSNVNFTLPCNRSCMQVPAEDVTLQLTSELWWQKQFTYNATSKQITNQLPPSRGSVGEELHGHHGQFHHSGGLGTE